MQLLSKVKVAAAVILVVVPLTVWSAEGVIEYVSGTVVIERDGRVFDADFGDQVSGGDVVATEADGVTVIRLNDRSQVKLRENTRIRIDSVTEQAAVTLNAGSLFARVARQSAAVARTAAGFEVRTPTVVAGVRGTEFFVAYGRTVEDAPDLWLCVNEGTVAVAVAGAGEPTLVQEGEGLNILAGRRATDPRRYPWTRELNWNFDPTAGDVADATNLDAAYADLLDQDYD